MARTKLNITWADLKSEKVEKKLAQMNAVSEAREHYEQSHVPSATPRKPRFPWIYNTVVYMGLFGLLGGLLGWGFGILLHLRPNARAEARNLIAGFQEIDARVSDTSMTPAEAVRARKTLDREGRDNPYYQLFRNEHLTPDERDARLAEVEQRDSWKDLIANILFYGVSGMMLAACLSAAETVVERNWRGAIVNGSVGAAVGLVGGLVVAMFADRLYHWVAGESGGESQGREIAARVIEWGVLGLFLTLGPGILMRNSRKLLAGMCGGLFGGLVGGLLFVPIKTLMEARFVDNGEIVSRLVGMLTIGVVAGIATGLIENVVKNGWFKVTTGLIAGKQFILYRNPTYIGSSPQSHIYLFKDPQVGRRHAAVHVLPTGFEIEDLPLGGKTLVNGRAVQRARLRAGDKVQVGATIFNFQEKPKAV